MLDKFKFTEAESREILQSLCILIDTREKANDHIINWFTDKKIQYKIKKLDYADYSFYLPANEKLSIPRDLYFTEEVCIERKGSLDELIGNFSEDRDRIEDEFLRHRGRMQLLIENSSYQDICEGNYRSNYSKKSAIGTLHTFSERYNVPFIFMDNKYSAQYIYCTFYYYLRNKLK